jgi:hypothetical protein
VRRSSARRIVADILRAVGRYAVIGLMGMQSAGWIVIMPEADEAGPCRCGDPAPPPYEPVASQRFRPRRRRARRLSAAERRAWVELEQRLR